MKKQTINIIIRRSAPHQYSIENIFNPIHAHLSSNSSVFNFHKTVLTSTSKGVFNKFRNIINALFLHADIHHITGDVNYIAPFIMRGKVILTIHDCNFIEEAKGLKKMLLKYFWLTLPLKRASVITVISKTTEKQLIELTSLTTNKIRVIPNFVNPSYTYKPRTFNKEKPVILQIGTKPNKNLKKIISALYAINCKLYILGDKKAEDVYLLKEKGIDYEYFSHLNEKEVERLYENSDIISLVSTSEGFGLPIIEGQTMGRAVITSNISGMKEVAGCSAMLVDPFCETSIRKGILELINNDSLRNLLIEKGITNSNKFKLNTVSEMYLNLYSKLS